VTTVEQIDAVVARIQYEHATAAHPCIFAYRLSDPPREARDDDFEDGAADRLLFLLTKLQLSDVIVCMSRYFGGILLGPDRFKHIMGRAKILLEQYQQNPSILPGGDPEPIESKSGFKMDLKAQRGSAFQEQWESKKL
jgi:putative IMPACT (imprinted ancient) family translation regulator